MTVRIALTAAGYTAFSIASIVTMAFLVLAATGLIDIGLFDLG